MPPSPLLSASAFSQAWLGAFAFSLQIFFDFSGYSDMAIGLARILGFRLMENFNRPFLAIGFAEFWRRWHISLSTWVRDYLYRPLRATAKPSQLRLYFILWICFLASGLWHGAAWTFIVWGAYNGFFMTLERLFLGRWLRKLPRVLGIALTFTAVTSGLAIFRSSNLSSAWLYLSVMADPGRTAAGGPFVITNDLIFVLVVGLAISFFPAFGWFERLHRIAATWRARPLIAMVSSLAILVLALGKATTITFHPFIYFRF